MASLCRYLHSDAALRSCGPWQANALRLRVLEAAAPKPDGRFQLPLLPA